MNLRLLTISILSLFLVIAMPPAWSFESKPLVGKANILVVEDFIPEEAVTGVNFGDILADAVRLALYQYRDLVTVPSRSDLWTFIKANKIGIDLDSFEKPIFQEELYNAMGVRYILRGFYRAQAGTLISTLSLIDRGTPKAKPLPTEILQAQEFLPDDLHEKSRSVAREIARLLGDRINTVHNYPTVSLIMGCFRSKDNDTNGQGQFSSDLFKDLRNSLRKIRNLEIYPSQDLAEKCTIPKNKGSSLVKGNPSYPQIEISGDYQVVEDTKQVRIIAQGKIVRHSTSSILSVPLDTLTLSYEPYAQVRAAVTDVLSQFVSSVIDSTGALFTEHLELLKPSSQKPKRSAVDLLDYTKKIMDQHRFESQKSSLSDTAIPETALHRLRNNHTDQILMLSNQALALLKTKNNQSSEDLLQLARAHYYQGLIQKELITSPKDQKTGNSLSHLRETDEIYSALIGKVPLSDMDLRLLHESRLERAELLSRYASSEDQDHAIDLYLKAQSEMPLNLLFEDTSSHPLFSDAHFRERVIRSIVDLATLYTSRRAWTQAQTLLEKLSGSRFASPAGLNLLANIYTKQERFNESLNLYRRVLDDSLCKDRTAFECRGALLGLRNATLFTAAQAVSLTGPKEDRLSSIKKSIAMISALEQYDTSADVYYTRAALHQTLSEELGEHRHLRIPQDWELYTSKFYYEKALKMERNQQGSWSTRYYRHSLDLIEELIVLGQTMEAYDKARHVVEGLLNEPDPGSTWHLYIARYLLKVSSLLSQGQVETDDSHGDDLASYQKPEELPWSFRVMDEFIDCSSQTRTNSDLKGRLREVTEKFISLLSYGEPEPVDRTAGACLP